MTGPLRETAARFPRQAPDPEERLRRDGFALGDWRIEPRRHRIVSGELEKTLDPRLLDVLVALAVAGGDVVTRDELLETVWKGTFVSENSLSQAISRLRRALGDDRQAPRYIETISRSGYRLVAAVETGETGEPAEVDEVVAPADAEPASPVAPGDAPAESQSRSRPWGWSLAAVAVAAVALLAIRGRTPSAPSADSLAPPQVRPELTLAGNQFGPRLSPSGDRVAFAWHGGDPDEDWDIWLQPIGGDNPVRVTDDPWHERLATWSPDGRRLAFVRFSEEETACGIFVVPAEGGPAERVADCLPGLRSLDWSPDGTTLAHNGLASVGPEESGSGSSRATALFLVDLESGARRQLSSPPEGIRGDINPRFSPDGSLLAFEREVGSFRNEVAVTSVADGATRLLAEGRWGRVRGVDWTADGSAVVVSSNRTGRFSLWKISHAVGEPELLPIEDDWVTQPSVARAGGRLVYRTFRDSVDLWELPLDGEGNAAGEPVRRMPSSRSERQPAWSPGADRIAFLSDRGGTRELWSGRPDGGELMRHTDLGGALPNSPGWSPDGERLIFDAALEGQSDLWVVERQSRRPRRLTSEASEERNGVFSRDGRQIYFTSDREGDWNLWRLAVDGGEPERLTTDGGFLAQESPDGERFFYTRLDRPGIWNLPRDGEESEPFVSDLDTADWGSWVVGDQGIYYLRRGPTAVAYAAFDGSTPRVVFEPAKQMPFLGRALSLSADGGSLLFSMIDHSDDEVMMVDLAGL